MDQMDLVKVEQLNNVCMTCYGDRNLLNVFDVHYFNGKPEICTRVIFSCFKLKFPSTCSNRDEAAVLCESCLNRLQEAYSFKLQIENSLKSLNKHKETSKVLNGKSNLGDSSDESDFETLKNSKMIGNKKIAKKKKSKRKILKNCQDAEQPKSNKKCDVFVKSEDIHTEITLNAAEIIEKTIITDLKPKKMKRRVISLEEKIKVLDRLQYGGKLKLISNELNLCESTIRTIKENESKIRAKASIVSSTILGRISRVKNALLAKMENILIIWIKDCNETNVPLNIRMIKQKALKIYKHLQDMDHVSSEKSRKIKFAGSNGWFNRFRNRFSLHNIQIQTECTPDTNFVDVEKSDIMS